MNKVKATVFVPTWFGEAYIESCLDMVFKQEVDFSFEVLVYDTSSKDKTPEIIKRFERKNPNLRYVTIQKEEFGHGKTRQRAAEDSKGEIVIYLTQDATPAHTRWLYEMVRPFDLNPTIVGVMGKQIPRPHCIPMLKSEINGVFSGFGPDFGVTLFYNDDFIRDQATFDAVTFYSDANSAARRKFLVGDIPYRDVSYAEDQLFGRDIITKGLLKAYAPRGAVIHSNDLRLGEYAKRMFDETFGLRSIGIPVQKPSMKAIVKLSVRGIIRDTRNILLDHDYSMARKAYWLVVNPLFHVQKWRGVRAAFQRPVTGDSHTTDSWSLEGQRHLH